MTIFKIGMFVLIIIISFYLVSLEDLKILSDQSLSFKLILIFISGLFYTSFLTAPLAVVLFAVLAGSTNIYLITILGGIGAVLGDLIIIKIFRFIFKPLSFLIHLDWFKGLKKKLHTSHLDVASYLFGMVIIASPFPDELGLVLLGTSRLSYFKLTILTFIANVIGIMAIMYTLKTIL